MLLNSNDIFEQIGLIVDNKQSQSVSSEQANYSVYLEIELSEGKHQLLQIKKHDEPHEVSVFFCKKHKLNSLAVEIVQNKIRQAKYRQEVRRNVQLTKREASSHSKNEYNHQFTPKKEQMTQEERQHMRTRVAVRGRAAQSKSISRSKSRYSKSPVKGVTKRIRNNEVEKEQPVKKRGNPDIGAQLHSKAMMKSKIQQNKRQKQKEKKEKQEEKQLTFQPKINPISAKIVQFRKQNPRQKQKQNKCSIMNTKNPEAEAMKQCTFKPHINKVSTLIAQNAKNYKDQYDHFTTLYKQAQEKQQKLTSEIDKSQEQLFQPKTNSRYREAIKESFQQRLEKSLAQKKKKLEQSEVRHQQYSFKPKIGRAPKDGRGMRTKDSAAPWDQLHYEKMKKSHTTAYLSEQKQQQKKTSLTTNFYYQHLIEKRVIEVFQALDGDEDGYISPQRINVQNLTKNELIFLKPVFEEIDELDAELDYNDFKKAIVNLMKEIDPAIKGAFLSEKPKIEEKESFKPLINQKSKQMMLSRVATTHSIYDQLYQQGLQQLQKKQHKLRLQKARQQQKQLQQCSFKPHLNNTSKYYIDKVLNKKINQKVEDESLQF